ncbi:MAG: DNRLRE domain-containing protein, partial [Dehalococcoidia bacterium]|nr:DNRLRE domain-containing protein [Dehalococcoidia bacterium]
EDADTVVEEETQPTTEPETTTEAETTTEPEATTEAATEPETTTEAETTAAVEDTQPEDEVLVNMTLSANANSLEDTSRELEVAEPAMRALSAEGQIRQLEVEKKEPAPAKTRAEQIERDNAEAMEVKNLNSAVFYEDMVPGTDVEYRIGPNWVSEYKIVKELQREYIYHYQLTHDGLVPVQQEDGSISFFKEDDTAEPLFVLEAPYMFDAAGEYSTAVTMTLYEDGLLVLTADAAWVNAPERVLPVTIDPTLTKTIDYTAMEDLYVNTDNSGNSNAASFAGRKADLTGGGINRAYMKFTLPTLPSGSVVAAATLHLFQNEVTDYKNNMFLYAFECPHPWNFQTGPLGMWYKWDPQPLYSASDAPSIKAQALEANGAFKIGLRQLDAVPIQESSGILNLDVDYHLDLTKAVRNWYENGNNNGVMLTTNNEGTDIRCKFYSTRSNMLPGFDYLRPSVSIYYSTNVGLESQWAYESVDMGRSGGIFVNHYNGHMTYIHNDINMTGNRLPISISHVNNSNHDNNSGTYQSMKLGVGFRLNIMEQLIAIATNDPLYAPNILKENGVPVLDKDGNAIDLGSYRYKLIDGDGTVHYFKEKTIKENGVNTIKTVHEYDSTQEFVASCAHSPSHWMLTDTQGNEKHYSKSHGYLVEIVDHNKNRQVITWSGGRITKVTDPALREVLFDYNTTTNYLNYIEDPAGRRTLFTYTGDQLTTITYPGGKTTKFLYNGSDISRVTATDNSYASVTYKSVQYNSGRRVSNISRRDKAGAEVDYLAFKYSETNASGQFTGSTEVKNKYDKWNRYFYNVLGGVTSAQNQDGYRQFGVTHIDNIKDGNKFNKVMASSDLQTIATNLLKNHGFEYTNTQWTRYYLSGSPGTIARSSQETKRGEWSMRVQSNTVNTYDAAGQAVTGTPGEIYTLSADVKIPEPLTTANGGAWIGFEYSVGGTWYKVKSEFVTSTSGWTRLVNTFQLPPNAATSFRVLLALETSKGTVYFDNVQLEQSGGSRHYNLVDNSDFSDAPGANQNPTGAAATNWIMTGVDTGDGVQYRPAPLDRNFVMMTGNPLKTKAITQTVYVNAKAGETLIIGGEAAAYAGNFPAKEHSFSIKALIYPTANGPALQQSVYVDFDPNVSMHFQTVAASIPLDTDCHRIDFSFIYDKQIGNVSFSDAFVYVGNFGESYEYDDDGQLTELRKNEYEKTSYTYEDNKLVAVDHAYGGIEGNIVSMEYNNNGNLLRMSNKDAVTEFTYNSQDNGQIKSQTVTQNSSSGEILTYTETMTYIQGGNYLEEETDARGGKTKYTYDTDRGLLTKVKDPKGNETVYSYDLTTDELLSVTGSGATTSFTTQNDLLKSITRNGTTYSYDYDNQNRITNAKVGTQNIVTNAYDSRQRLSQQTYGNGTVYAPVYDSRDRMVGEKWNNVQTAEFFYNENGQLSKLVDQTTNTAYSYSYYFDGLVRKISGSDGSLTEFNYDVNGAVASLTHSLNNSILHDATYTRNGNGSPIMATLYSLDGAGLDYEYDALGRLTERRLSTASASLSNSVSYLEVNGNTTNFVETYTNEDSYLGVLQHYEYEYDKNGNITSVTDVNGRTTTYTYDGLNRLTGETGPFGTYKYNYDIGGNLTSVTKDGKTLNSYTYGHANWKDRLTAFGGKPISYDAIGNPTSYDSQSFTWEKGRQLASITGNGQDVSYTYDAQGRRTSKTVGGVNGVTTHYTYAGDLLIRQSDGTDTLDFAYDAGGIAVGFTHNGTPYYYLRNLQGDVVAITDAEGTIVAEYHYDAWGNQIDIVPVTGICIGVRTSNQTRPILSNGLPEPFTVFYNATSDTDHSVRLTPNVSPTDASIKGVTWSAARVLDSHEPSTLPTFNAVSGTTARLVKPSKTTAPNGQFIREYTAETDDGGFTAQQIVIGVERLPNPMKTEKIYTAADAFSGPYDDEQSTFPLLDTLVQDTQIQVRGRYDADWYYITWGNNNWGYIKLDDALCGCGLHGCNYCECDCQLCKPCTCGLHECPYCVCDPHTCPTCECSCNICDPCECGLHECVYCECFCEICVSERFAIEFLEMALLANALRTAGVPASLVMPVAAQIMPMGILSSGRYLLETNPVTADELIFVI